MIDRLHKSVCKILKILKSKNDASASERTALIAFAIRLFSAALAFASQIILARLMGEYQYGIFVFVWVTAIISGNLSCLGFHTLVLRFLPQYADQGENNNIAGLVSSARFIAFTSASLLAAIGLSGLYIFGEHFDNYYIAPLYTIMFALPMIALGDTQEGTARANSWPVFALAPTYIIRPLLIIVIFSIALSFSFSASAEVAIGSALIACYLTTLVQVFTVGRALRKKYPSKFKTTHIKTWLIVAFPIFLIEGFYFLLTNSDVIIVGIYLPPEQVAIYFAAAKTMALVHFVYFAVKAGIAPRFAKQVGKSQKTELERSALQATIWVFWPSLLIGICLIVLSPYILQMFGDNFINGRSVMVFLFLGIMAKALVGPAEVLLTMAGEQKICALVYLIALLCNISLNIYLIPQFGIDGAALATMGAMMVEALVLYLVVVRRLSIHMSIFTHLLNLANKNRRPQ